MTPPRIAVVGSINLDLVVATHRLPEPGETVLGADVVYRSGGKGANQAVAASRYGAQVSFHGCVGSDTFGDQLRSDLARDAIDLDRLSTIDDRPSGMALIVVDEQGRNTITVSAGANNAVTADDFEPSAVDALLMQLEIPVPAVVAAAEKAAAASVPVFLNAAPLPDNPSPELKRLISSADVLIVNETEANSLHAAGDDWIARARSLTELGPRLVVSTLGADGAGAAGRDQAITQPGFSIDAVDPTGAGDTFCGVLATELTRGTELAGALARACMSGAIATTQQGARDAMPTEAETIQRLNEGISR